MHLMESTKPLCFSPSTSAKPLQKISAVPVPGQTAAPFAFPSARAEPPPRAALPAGVRAVALVSTATHTVRVLSPEGIAVDESTPGRLRLADPDVTIEFRDFTLSP